MRLAHSITQWREVRHSADFSGRTIGFVPTMGALHAGHAALLERARRENERVVLSIFVNPTQFNDPRDLEKYPRTWEADMEIARSAGVDAVFAPDRGQMYPDDYRYRVTEDGLSARMEGAHRPGHFDGVLTVVLKLLLLVAADRAYFGEKDMQQLLLVRDMARAFLLPTQIVPCATVRAEDGLALSSRNVRLTAEGRARAPQFARALREGGSAEQARRLLETAGFAVDYVEDFEQWRLGAVRIDGIRLIDNVRRTDSL